jgi:hypothetical protein
MRVFERTSPVQSEDHVGCFDLEISSRVEEILEMISSRTTCQRRVGGDLSELGKLTGMFMALKLKIGCHHDNLH